MRVGRLWLVSTLWVAVMSVACAQETDRNNLTLVSDGEHMVVPTATPDVRSAREERGSEQQSEVVVPTAAPDVQSARGHVGSERQNEVVVPTATPDVQSARDQLGGGSGFAPFDRLASLEEVILESEVIARVTYLRNQGSIMSHRWGWMALLEFRFEVHEYLKGSGPDEIGAFIVAYYGTEEHAQWARPLLAAAHDSRWDDREAIVFLNYPDELDLPSHQLGAGQYWLANVGGGIPGYSDGYSVASDRSKLWLPEATQTTQTGPGGSATNGQSSKATTPQLFMLEAPSGASGGSGVRSASSAAAGPTISLGDMKSRITTLEAEANAGGTPEYRSCVETYYQDRRRTLESIARVGQISHRWNFSIDSGLPAGTVVKEFRSFVAPSPDSFGGRMWYEGPDRDFMQFKHVNFVTSTRFGGLYEYTLQLTTARPLAAKTYTLFPNWHLSETCGKDWSFAYNRQILTLTVTATSTRTLHEAFFDPVDIGTAVGADSANGVLKPNAFSLDGANTTISSLKWENGAVSMTLSPTASLADYAIDVTGATTLSLSSGNASTTPLTWTVPDKPWSDGDLLMLRIHRPISTDATLSDLALTGIDLTFSPATTTYTADVPATTTQTTVTPTANHGSATYVVKLAGVVDNDGTIDLAVGDNVITVVVTAEDNTTTNTYTLTVTRATPSDLVTITLIPRVDGLTFFDIDIQWSYSGTCENYSLAITTDTEYMIRSLGFHPPQASSHYVQGGWLYDSVPDFWVVVQCRGSGETQEVGRASLRAAHPDNN